MPAVQNRAPLLAPLLEALGGGDWFLAGRAATVLWELAYDEGMGNNFLTVQVRAIQLLGLLIEDIELSCPIARLELKIWLPCCIAGARPC